MTHKIVYTPLFVLQAYYLKVTAHNNAGSTVQEYSFKTLPENYPGDASSASSAAGDGGNLLGKPKP